MTRRSSLLVRGAVALAAAFATTGLLALATPARAEVDPSNITQRQSKSTPLTYHYPERYAPAIDRLDEKSPEAVDELETYLGFETFPSVDVWVLPTVRDYFEHKGIENRAPEWAIGLSLGDSRTVVVARDTDMPGGVESDLERTFVHELAHVAIGVAEGRGRVPRWFNEGLALMVADEWTADRSDKLTRAASTGSLIPFGDLDDSFPGHHNVASLAYAQSFDMVKFITRREGDRVVAEIFNRVEREVPFDRAVEASTGRTLADLQKDWRDGLTESTSWMAILRDEMLLFSGAALIAVLAWFVRRGFRRRRADEDEPDEDWDYDESRYPLPGEENESG